MLKVSVQLKGVTPQQMSLKINETTVDIERAMLELGKQTVDKMREVISAGTVRRPASNTLSNAIQVHEDRKAGYAIGIGKKDILPPYWYVLNFGVKFTGEEFIPGGGKTVRGDFGGSAPNSAYAGSPGGAGVRMTHPGAFAVTATHAIQPMNYIEKTSNWLEGYFVQFITTVANRR